MPCILFACSSTNTLLASRSVNGCRIALFFFPYSISSMSERQCFRLRLLILPYTLSLSILASMDNLCPGFHSCTTNLSYANVNELRESLLCIFQVQITFMERQCAFTSKISLCKAQRYLDLPSLELIPFCLLSFLSFSS